MANFKDISLNGLWKQNPGVVQLLGLCPTLAVTSTLVNGFSLGLLTAVVMGSSNLVSSICRNWISKEIRNPVFILIIASLVTVIDLGMNAYVHPLYLVLGIFIPLIVTNCVVLARVESFAAKNSPNSSALDGFMMGLGLTGVLTLLGSVREILGKGTLLSGIDLALGPQAKAWVIHLIPDYNGFLLAILPPGAFIGLGLLIAIRNWLETRNSAPQSQASTNALKPQH